MPGISSLTGKSPFGSVNGGGGGVYMHIYSHSIVEDLQRKRERSLSRENKLSPFKPYKGSNKYRL